MDNDTLPARPPRRFNAHPLRPMWKQLTTAMMTLSGVSAMLPAVAADVQFAWPGGAVAAVSLAYDDALDSQLDTAIPALDRAGLKGSFYLTLSSETLNRRMADWRAAAVRGHELGNHTLFHQCSRSGPDRAWVSADNDIDQISATQLAAQIRLGNTLLHAIDGKRERTFTTPCGDLMAGGEPYLGLIKVDFVAMKSASGGVVPSMATLDPYSVGVAAPSDVTGTQLIDLVKQAAQAGTMANITFHGIGGDYLSVSAEAHEQLLKYLADNRSLYWTDTFLNIMKYVKSQREKALGLSLIHI
jgi:peptidoglycan/xylan/chitin deacetylase (PgdA/CDA1 family)